MENGWDGTSVRGIAQRAEVSRPAIARRWPSKAHLVLEALLGAEPDLVAFEGADLLGWIDGIFHSSWGSVCENDFRPYIDQALDYILSDCEE